MIYSFRYKGKFNVTEGHLEADNLTAATDMAQKWIAQTPGAVYIPNSVMPWLITLPVESETAMLAEAVTYPAGSVLSHGHKPSQAEQKAALAKAGEERRSGTGPGSTPKADGRVGA